MIRSPDPPESGVLACVRSTDPQCTRALLDSGVLSLGVLILQYQEQWCAGFEGCDPTRITWLGRVIFHEQYKRAKTWMDQSEGSWKRACGVESLEELEEILGRNVFKINDRSADEAQLRVGAYGGARWSRCDPCLFLATVAPPAAEVRDYGSHRWPRGDRIVRGASGRASLYDGQECNIQEAEDFT
ncbi:hypothetical protein ACLOJK_037256 [Asimina triloba]